jgi:hypothetical protein
VTDDDQGRDTFYRRPQAGIVSINSHTAMLNPSRTTASVGICVMRALKLTIDFLIVLQICERVKTHFTMKRHMRPTDASEAATVEILEDILNAPVPSVRENQLLLVKRSRPEPTHISVSGKMMSA